MYEGAKKLTKIGNIKEIGCYAPAELNWSEHIIQTCLLC